MISSSISMILSIISTILLIRKTALSIDRRIPFFPTG